MRPLSGAGKGAGLRGELSCGRAATGDGSLAHASGESAPLTYRPPGEPALACGGDAAVRQSEK
ncbi:hypothetical protein SDC9_167589 [bioreactor metagenome]|uniref:Uncharacterized protein n=1 Tax=bioreactor metagenome TaxID=1076179 RepID=A0A645G075_9ZZZZ